MLQVLFVRRHLNKVSLAPQLVRPCFWDFENQGFDHDGHWLQDDDFCWNVAQMLWVHGRWEQALELKAGPAGIGAGQQVCHDIHVPRQHRSDC